jgi:hypothetical protein
MLQKFLRIDARRFRQQQHIRVGISLNWLMLLILLCCKQIRLVTRELNHIILFFV